MKRPVEAWILYIMLAFLSVNGLIGGGSMILVTDGSFLGLNLEWLTHSPFHTFLVPGILLFFFMGVFPAVALAGLISKNTRPFPGILNIYPGMDWGWTYALYSGIVSVIWIVFQQLLTDYFILQPLIAGLGILIVIFCLLPRIQKYYRVL